MKRLLHVTLTTYLPLDLSVGDDAREELSDVRADGVLTASPSIDTLLGLLVSIPLSVVSLDTLLIT